MNRLDSNFSYEWHVAINRANPIGPNAKRHDWMYDAKDAADEVPRLAMLFRMEREKSLPAKHKQCSLSPDEPIDDNKLTCCLGVDCRDCDALKALDSAALKPEEIDLAKAWTCAAHILMEDGDSVREGYVLTKSDRMYWDRVYQNLSEQEPPEISLNRDQGSAIRTNETGK